MGISIWQLAIILVIVLLLFGTKKLRSIGTDLGGAVKGFRGAMDKVDAQKESATNDVGEISHANSESSADSISGSVIEGEVTHEKEKEKV